MDFDSVMDFHVRNKDAFNDMVRLIKAGKIIPYVGAGISWFAFKKTWRDFLKCEYTKYLHKPLPPEINCYQAADHLANDLGEPDFYKDVRTVFGGDPNFDWLPIIEQSRREAISIIPLLFPGLIITTNFDQLFERIFPNQLYRPMLPHNGSEEPIIRAMRENSPLIYKIHGTIEDSENIIFTSKNYDGAYNSESKLVKNLTTAFTSIPMLFLGCGLLTEDGLSSDKPIELWQKIAGAGAENFAIFPCEPGKQDEVRKKLSTMRITPILYDINHHESVRTILETILYNVNKNKYIMGVSEKTIIEPEAFSDMDRFNYKSDSVKFFAREKELENLDAFLKDKKKSLWWGISGEGGCGKSRLVYHFSQKARASGWVIHEPVNKNFDYLSSKYQKMGNEPTLFIFDYISANVADIGQWIHTLEDEPHSNKIRFLLIERHRENVELQELLAESLDTDGERSLKQKCYQKDLRLSTLSKDALKDIMKDYANQRGNSLSETTLNIMFDKLEMIDPDLQRPLFALFIVDAQISGNSIVEWDKKSALEYVLKKEANRIKMIISSKNNNRSHDMMMKIVEHALIYASFTNGIEINEYFNDLFPETSTRLRTFLDAVGIDKFHDFFAMLGICEKDNIIPMKPDLIGEYFIIDSLEKMILSDQQIVKEIIGKAWYHPRRMSETMNRILNDYSDIISNELKRFFSSIEIPDGISHISRNAFSNGRYLNSVILPESVIDIHASAFKNCTSLKSIKIPKSITRISSGTFVNCISLSNVSFPENLESIGSEAFRNCIALNPISLPDGIVSIEREAFRGCTKLAHIKIPGSLKAISPGTFKECFALKDVTWNSALEIIGKAAFDSCSSLKINRLPDSVTSLGASAFEDCTSIESIRLSPDIKKIDFYTFARCSSLTTVDFPTKINEIDCEAFEGCISLKTVFIPNRLTEIGLRAFHNCKNLTNVNIDSGVDDVGHFAFAYCTNLKSITLTKTSIVRDYAFRGCHSLPEFICPKELAELGAGAFEDCTSLNRIELSDNLTAINKYTFESCSSLSQIDLPNNITIIGLSAFARSALKAIRIPASVEKIGIFGFAECTDLYDVTFLNSRTDVFRGAFSNCQIEKFSMEKWQQKKIVKTYSEIYVDIPLENRTQVGRDYHPEKKRLERPDLTL